ncbi:tRNA preQ1(34) S-adenosylmethionine ribosyltransferase-isomerase QueA [Rhabdothermincola salaria]|uniref:tRNA preQ1(34) S-adenosylmethionine ribosyltransferase-isomerase QueA n=1 Tax=Rhabdothermincola salaria TaxID=2903142 RepID=UPI001E3C47D5|nr:tRNA preQ1(34) S-adenosylmethionine ribosyltransferase-isomerase QueA [Rhabdothermincola salaria]
METAAFDYDLPEAAIAQEPLARRDAARLLVDRGPGRTPEHRQVADLAELLDPGDLLVVNTTRVLPARLALVKPTGGAAEVLLLERLGGPTDGSAAGGDGGGGGSRWEALVRPSRRVAPGSVLHPPDGDDELEVEVGEDLGEGRRIVELRTVGDELDVLARHGAMPLPPYITAPLAEAERYQTVYAERPASAAAPTAGLHLTPELLERIADKGVGRADVELVVGLGTFRPIAVDDVRDHVMHAEHYRVPAATMEACTATRAAGGRVVAVGTTAVRALESAAATGALVGRTDLFIHRPYPWRVVDRLLTNFHLPRSSLLVMIDAFVGPRWRDLYATALADGYRFLSFGDAMLLDRSEGPRP